MAAEAPRIADQSTSTPATYISQRHDRAASGLHSTVTFTCSVCGARCARPTRTSECGVSVATPPRPRWPQAVPNQQRRARGEVRRRRAAGCRRRRTIPVGMRRSQYRPSAPPARATPPCRGPTPATVRSRRSLAPAPPRAPALLPAHVRIRPAHPERAHRRRRGPRDVPINRRAGGLHGERVPGNVRIEFLRVQRTRMTPCSSARAPPSSRPAIPAAASVCPMFD